MIFLFVSVLSQRNLKGVIIILIFLESYNHMDNQLPEACNMNNVGIGGEVLYNFFRVWDIHNPKVQQDFRNLVVSVQRYVSCSIFWYSRY